MDDDESPEKSKSVDGGASGGVVEADIVTPRTEHRRHDEMLEVNVSPDSKFSIQMSPSKGDKPPPQLPPKKGQKKEPQVKILDHGLLDVPLVDDSVGLSAFFRLPKYKPRGSILGLTDDVRLSQKSEARDEDESRIHSLLPIHRSVPTV